MEQKKYNYKTTKAEYQQMVVQSKNKGELLYKVWKSETGKYLPYQEFLSLLATWIRTTKRHDTRSGIEKINTFLDKEFAQE